MQCNKSKSTYCVAILFLVCLSESCASRRQSSDVVRQRAILQDVRADSRQSRIDSSDIRTDFREIRTELHRIASRNYSPQITDRRSSVEVVRERRDSRDDSRDRRLFNSRQTRVDSRDNNRQVVDTIRPKLNNENIQGNSLMSASVQVVLIVALIGQVLHNSSNKNPLRSWPIFAKVY